MSVTSSSPILDTRILRSESTPVTQFYQLAPPVRKIPTKPATPNMESKSGPSKSSSKSDSDSLFAHLHTNDDAQRTTITGDGSLLPPPFHGLPTENPAEWMTYFRTYTAYKAMSPAQALQLLKVLARDSFADWIHSLAADVQDAPDQFALAFAKHYLRSPARQLRLGQQLFSRKQAANESADDYILAIQALARQMAPPPSRDILQHAIVAGLRPDLAGPVMAFTSGENFTTLDEFFTMIRRAELMTSGQHHNNDQSVADLATEIRKLGERFDKATV